jgi:hypothetical protein
MRGQKPRPPAVGEKWACLGKMGTLHNIEVHEAPLTGSHH